jgi:hypothetical protein
MLRRSPPLRSFEQLAAFKQVNDVRADIKWTVGAKGRLKVMGPELIGQKWICATPNDANLCETSGKKFSLPRSALSFAYCCCGPDEQI